MRSYHLLIKGKVQGVFYRVSAKAKADELGVKGWIKNTPTGDVEAIVTGTQNLLEVFITWCKQGPEQARVAEVVVTPKQGSVHSEFVILR